MSLGNEAKVRQERYDAFSMDRFCHAQVGGQMQNHEIDSHRRIVKERRSDETRTEREDTMVVNALGESKLLIKEEAQSTPAEIADYYGASEVVSQKTKRIDMEERGIETANQTVNAPADIGAVHENPSESQVTPSLQFNDVEVHRYDPAPSSITRQINNDNFAGTKHHNSNTGEDDRMASQELVEPQKINDKLRTLED